jgi:hypothetical protein
MRAGSPGTTRASTKIISDRTSMTPAKPSSRRSMTSSQLVFMCLRFRLVAACVAALSLPKVCRDHR